MLLAHIKDISTELFIEIATTDNFTLLGSGTTTQLQEAWEAIKEQYDNAIGSKDIFTRMDRIKELYIIQSKIARGNAALLVLSVIPSIENYNALFALDYDLPAMEYNEKSLERIPVLFKAHQKKDIAALNFLIAELESSAKKETQSKATRENFIGMVGAFTTHFKMSFNIKNESVEMYCTYVKMYINEVEKIIKSQKKNG